MTAAFTILSLICLGWRVYTRRMTKVEWVLLAIWFGHLVLEEAQLIAYVKSLYYSPRFMRPAEFLLWPWLAWGVCQVYGRTLGRVKVKWILLAALALIATYDVVMLVKPVLPIGRRGAYVAAAEWAAQKIREDWKGPAADERAIFDLGEYRVANRPVVDCYTPRVAYLVNGRANGIDEGGDTATAKADRADYWINDLRRDDPPQPASDWELMGTFKRGKYELPLYRRIK